MYESVNRNDGFSKEWGRVVSSVGMFQIHEPTGIYLYSRRGVLGSSYPTKLATPPKDPAHSQVATVKWLKHPYASQRTMGAILATLGMQFIRGEGFEIDDNGLITSVKDPGDHDLQDYVNSVVGHGVRAEDILLRMFWMYSSKKGPRTLLAQGKAKKVVESRYLPRLMQELVYNTR